MNRHRPVEPAATGALDSEPLAALQEVSIVPRPLEQLAAVLTPARAARLTATADKARAAFGERVVWHVNSTASGGGVAEMLQTLLAYGNGAGIENRWLVLDGDPRLLHHHQAHAQHAARRPRRRRPARPAEHAPLRRPTGTQPRRPLLAKISPTRHRRYSTTHRPPAWPRRLGAAGVRVVWRCHVGQRPAQRAHRHGLGFLRPYARPAPTPSCSPAASTRRPGPRDRLDVIPPSIDPFSRQEHANSPRTKSPQSSHAWDSSTDCGPGRPVSFHRRDGTTGHVRPHHPSIVLDGSPPPTGVPLVVQVSRWDRLKDMAGVMAGFAEMRRHDAPARRRT